MPVELIVQQAQDAGVGRQTTFRGGGSKEVHVRNGLELVVGFVPRVDQAGANVVTAVAAAVAFVQVVVTVVVHLGVRHGNDVGSHEISAGREPERRRESDLCGAGELSSLSLSEGPGYDMSLT
jgi:hypothetical protein